MFRHLPPTATPINLRQLVSAFRPISDADERFRAAFVDRFGVRNCLTASSGRTAFYLTLKALAANRDHVGRDEIVLPAYTCPSLAKVAFDLGLRPRLVDISPQTLIFDEAQLELTINARTLAVICVHPFGIPQPVDEVMTLAHAAGAVVIEDAAQAMGAEIGGTPVGAQGDFGLFSLGPGKPISAGGGGIICTNNAAYARQLEEAWSVLPEISASAERLAWARLTAFSAAFRPAGWWLATRAGAQRVGDNEGSWGYSLTRLTQTQSALALGYLDELDAINAGRRARAEQMLTRIGAFPEGADGSVLTPIPLAPSGKVQPIYLRLPVIARDEAQQERIHDRLWAAGIGVGRMYKRTLADFFPQLAGGEFPGAERVARCLLTLPTHHFVREDDVKKIADIFEQEYRSGRS